MMLQMIFLKRNGAGKYQREIGNDSGNAVEGSFLEEQVMRAFVDTYI
jgi:hypothetical protein